VADGYNVKKGGDQYLHLAAAQALAYVRDRDSLPEIDLDRTHRQQAVIDYVIWKMKTDGALSDLGALNTLLGTASQYLITDSTFSLLDFATNMRALSGSNMTFETLPVASEATVPLNGSSQDVNIIDVPYIQQLVRSAFDPQPAGTQSATPTSTPSTITVDVYNGSDTAGLADNVSQALVGLGYKAGAVANSTAQSQTVDTDTQVFYGSGASANATSIASEFGTSAQPLTSLPAGHVEVLLGSSATSVPAGLGSSSTQSTQSTSAKVIGGQASAGTAATASPSTVASPAATPGANDGQSGGAVTVAPNAPYGIPCVY
jgi:hypothetical protein